MWKIILVAYLAGLLTIPVTKYILWPILKVAILNYAESEKEKEDE